ncbi:unnamed protein product [Schistosoma margrebowiei]|uniref:Uncharacterized protein n=1 Tax=Schistosoma margrebowiei TaxID=48269 RepID=A0A183NC88_9TREM|nr:unnamed protein product [Schistosoma margrebowiei]
MAIRQIRSEKAVGHDNIPTEALKSHIENIQYQRQHCSTVRSRNSENHHKRHQISTSIYKQSSPKYTESPLAPYCQQQTTM